MFKPNCVLKHNGKTCSLWCKTLTIERIGSGNQKGITMTLIAYSRETGTWLYDLFNNDAKGISVVVGYKDSLMKLYDVRIYSYRPTITGNNRFFVTVMCASQDWKMSEKNWRVS